MNTIPRFILSWLTIPTMASCHPKYDDQYATGADGKSPTRVGEGANATQEVAQYV